jgi:integrase
MDDLSHDVLVLVGVQVLRVWPLDVDHDGRVGVRIDLRVGGLEGVEAALDVLRVLARKSSKSPPWVPSCRNQCPEIEMTSLRTPYQHRAYLPPVVIIASWRPRNPPNRLLLTSATGDVPDAVARYIDDLERVPIAVRTREAYASHVGAYGRWLTRQADAPAALAQPRDHSGRDFKRYLKLEQGWKPASVNLALAAVDHFNRFLGLGPAIVSRRAVGADRAARAVGRGATRASARDRGLQTARQGDRRAAALHGAAPDGARDARRRRCANVGAQGPLVVRSDKGDLYREVPMNRPVREALDAWLQIRSQRVAAGEVALFVGSKGRRLSPRAVDMVVRNTARRAGLPLSAHVLRHTCVTNLVRGGNDIVLVAELAGHRRLETTRRYSLPSAADRQAAMDGLEIEP